MLPLADALAAVATALVLFHTILAYQSACAGGWALTARSLVVYNPTTQKEVA